MMYMHDADSTCGPIMIHVQIGCSRRSIPLMRGKKGIGVDEVIAALRTTDKRLSTLQHHEVFQYART